MGEIDTKSIESVQAALSLFGRKNDQRKHRSISITEVQFTKFNGKMRSDNQELLLTDLANYKEELRNAKAEISSTEESKVSPKKAVELMAIAVDMEKEKTEELLRCVSEFNDVVLLSKVAAIEAENKYSII
ncbi:hypothetical protein IFM89_001468 [Coptis chinensis]|uniref:Uncharacterized protein n=1 Tax=Coptis chinensis TaxID=261450 RepID=A0A835GY61_9MAGN|nr:hypothetical protein IFM89_001468 [Coptis chinensis]